MAVFVNAIFTEKHMGDRYVLRIATGASDVTPHSVLCVAAAAYATVIFREKRIRGALRAYHLSRDFDTFLWFS